MSRLADGILALDLATKTGWAHASGRSGTWDFSIRKNESAGMRLVRLQNEIQKIHDEEGITIVTFEVVMARFGQRHAMIVQAELQGTVKLWCENRTVPYQGFTSTAIKKHALGAGNASGKKGRGSKEKMIEAAERKWKRPFDDEDNNEVDALWLLSLSQSELLDAI